MVGGESLPTLEFLLDSVVLAEQPAEESRVCGARIGVLDEVEAGCFGAAFLGEALVEKDEGIGHRGIVEECCLLLLPLREGERLEVVLFEELAHGPSNSLIQFLIVTSCCTHLLEYRDLPAGFPGGREKELLGARARRRCGGG